MASKPELLCFMTNCSKWQASSCTRKSARTWGITRSAYSNATLPSFFLFTICSRAPKTFPVLGSKANCHPAVRLGKTCRTASFFLQWQEPHILAQVSWDDPSWQQSEEAERNAMLDAHHNVHQMRLPSLHWQEGTTAEDAWASWRPWQGSPSWTQWLLSTGLSKGRHWRQLAVMQACWKAADMEREHRHRGKQEDDPWDADLADEWELDVVALMSGSGMVKSEHLSGLILWPQNSKKTQIWQQ